MRYRPTPLLVSLSLLAVMATPRLGYGAELAERLDGWIRPFAEVGHLSGCILVADGDAVIYEECFGDANVELGVTNSPQTRFAIASITKALQLVLLGQLVDEGRLSLDDPIARWLPQFPLADSLTVGNLANHTAGVPHRVIDQDAETVSRTAAEMVEFVQEKGLLEETIGTYNYSSAGYSVLARVIELAGGETWETLMERYVFAPAKMKATHHPSGRRLIPLRASSYRWAPGGLLNIQPKDLSFLVGAGSLYSTPRDLWQCARAIVAGTYGETAKDYLLGDGEMRSNGRTNGYRAFLDYDLETGHCLVLCANTVTGAADRIREAVPRILAGETLDPPRIPDVTITTIPQEELEQFSGLYELRPGSVLDVHPRGPALYANDWLLLPQGGDEFFSVQDYSAVLFVRDTRGAVQRMDWGDGPFVIPRVGDRRSASEGESERK